MRRLPGLGEKGASAKGVSGGRARGTSGFGFPGFNPSDRIHATHLRNIQASPYYVALQQLQEPGQIAKKKAFVAALSRGLYQKLNRDASPTGAWRYLRMESFAGAPDLRNLLSLAAKLRRLANDSHCRGDQALYLMTAEALEKRAEWLAATLPSEKTEQQGNPRLHKPVDLTI